MNPIRVINDMYIISNIKYIISRLLLYLKSFNNLKTDRDMYHTESPLLLIYLFYFLYYIFYYYHDYLHLRFRYIRRLPMQSLKEYSENNLKTHF